MTVILGVAQLWVWAGIGLAESELGQLWRTGPICVWDMYMGLKLEQAAAQGL